MKRSVMAAIAAGLLLSAPAVSVTPSSDPLSRMFAWWDMAFKQKDGFTAEAFRRYFTEDATLTIQDSTVIHGIPEWVEHFRKIQESGREVEIVVPFKSVFQNGSHIYTYHIIRSRGGGKVSCMIAAGDATLKDGKISSIRLVRAELDETARANEADCWQQ